MDKTTPGEEVRRRSRWIMRAREWDDAKARYPNLWVDGMPRQVLAMDRLASRLRLGDLIAVFHPASTRYAARAERFVGLSRVVGLRLAYLPGSAWIDLETAHRFEPALDLGRAPRRVFMCCDAGWPKKDAALFREVFDAAVRAGWQPQDEDLEHPPKADISKERAQAIPARTSEEAPAIEEPSPAREEAPEPAGLPPAPESTPESQVETTTTPIRREREPAPDERSFVGAEYSGDMRDPRDHTWVAVVALSGKGESLLVRRLEPTGRSGLEALLRNPDRQLSAAEAVGLGVPFGLPVPFAESLLGGAFPEEGWWALARKLARVSRPDYLGALQDFREAHGELGRLTDERVGGASPLRRVDPDLGSRAYHGIRMIAEDRSRFAIRPFESAQGKLLFEVSPTACLDRLGLDADQRGKAEAVLDRLGKLERWPVQVQGAFRRRCVRSAAALAAVLAARSAAVAVLTGETGKTPEELDAEQAQRVRQEGWIYGLADPGESVAAS